jgi:hypothetical protein
MRRLAVVGSLAVVLLSLTTPAVAHRSGCHRWHSCRSDTGSYVCGDTGHCSACTDNQYCEAGQLRRTSSDTAKAQAEAASRLGAQPQSMTCPANAPIKGNFTTYSGERCIYHVPAGEFYSRTKPERCYATEAETRQDGCRKSLR